MGARQISYGRDPLHAKRGGSLLQVIGTARGTRAPGRCCLPEHQRTPDSHRRREGEREQPPHTRAMLPTARSAKEENERRALAPPSRRREARRRGRIPRVRVLAADGEGRQGRKRTSRAHALAPMARGAKVECCAEGFLKTVAAGAEVVERGLTGRNENGGCSAAIRQQ